MEKYNSQPTHAIPIPNLNLDSVFTQLVCSSAYVNGNSVVIQ